jgi:aldose 1-epimerase
LEVEAGGDGYPGNRRFITDYTLGADGRLTIRLKCETDAPTWVNLSNHLYWNLSGDFRKTVADHRLCIGASRAVWNDAEHIPQAYRMVSGTALDFRAGAALGERLAQPEPQIVSARGLNNLYLLDRPDGSEPAARLTHPASGRAVSLYTDLPAVMLYTGGYLDHTIALEEDGFASPGCALALEPQLLPITPNMREASVVTTPEHPYDHWIAYAFGTDA